MRSPLALLATLLLAAFAAPACAGSPFAVIPAGTPVRVTSAVFPAQVRGTLLNAGEDSLRVLPARGGAPFAIANGAVRSLEYRSARRPCGRMDVLLGIGAGMVGGAVLGAALNGENHEGGGGTGEGEDERDHASEAGEGVSAAAATVATPSTSTAYRAVTGAVLGGIAGGVLGRLFKLGFREDVWSTVPGPVSRALGVPPSPARSVFTVRIPLGPARAGS
jgi:hypothetical protein